MELGSSRREMPFVTALVTDPWSQSCSLLSFSQFMPLRNVGWVPAVFLVSQEKAEIQISIWNLTFKQKTNKNFIIILLLYYSNTPPPDKYVCGLNKLRGHQFVSPDVMITFFIFTVTKLRATFRVYFVSSVRAGTKQIYFSCVLSM